MSPYEILGVSPSASNDEIKKAFHRLAHKHHPDKGGDAEMFKKISNAYSQIKDRPEPTSAYGFQFKNKVKVTRWHFDPEVHQRYYQNIVDDYVAQMQAQQQYMAAQQRAREELLRRMMGKW